MSMDYFLNLKKIMIGASLFFILSPIMVSAQNAVSNTVGSLLEETGKAAQYETADVKEGKITITTVVGGIIEILLSFLGIIFIVLMIYGGFLWMTARGNDDQVEKSKEMIKNAVIGLIIVISAYAITFFVLSNFTKGYIINSF